METERGGVICLLPDNLNEIGVEYVEVSYYIVHTDFFFFTLCLNMLLCLEF